MKHNLRLLLAFLYLWLVSNNRLDYADKDAMDTLMQSFDVGEKK